MQIIGIDIGTTSISGVLIDADNGEVLKSKTENSEAFIETGKSFEKIQSVEKIIAIATDILDSLISSETVSIGVTGQMHGIVYYDRLGNHVSPLYTWQDKRGDEPYLDSTYAEYLNSCSGYGNVTDFYNKINGLVPESAVGFCTIHDYFVMKLCENSKPIIHLTDAASFGCFDIENNTFTYDNRITATGDYSVAGKYKNIPVGIAIGDNQASVFSSVSNQSDVLINVGTGSQISMISDTVIKSDLIEVRPYFEGKYLLVGAALCGGRAYSMLKSFYMEILKCVADVDDIDVYNIMSKMLLDRESTVLTVDTRFAGTRINPEITGGISNITVSNFTPFDLTRGFIEGIINELHDMYLDFGIKANGIVGSGNGIKKNTHLVKCAENKFGALMKIPKHTEEAAFGAAMFGAICVGVYENSDDAKKIIKYI